MSDGSPERPIPVKRKATFHRKAAWCLAAVVVLGVPVAWYLRPGGPAWRHPTTAETDPFALPEIAPSPFRNASGMVGYVGSRECVDCHRDEHASYLHTTHSRSLGDIDVAREPPDGEFRHELSGRSYRISRDGRTLKLREFIHDDAGREVVLADHAAGLALGSGNYSRTYLVKMGDFLIAAPVTWYPRRKTWGMSAGYERDPLQRGFNRAISAGCLSCHAGRVETLGGSDERMKVAEMAIGCERCHGPGELHVKERTAKLPKGGCFDDTIVNPRRLPRERQEDVCSQCHLSGSARVAVRGRRKEDYRPGLRMSDFVVNFQLDRSSAPISVSGQTEQMRLSRCYVESKTMTCTTCHDPHSPPDDGAKVEHYRGKCLSCHKPESCGVPVKVRQEKAKDNCVTCHMPRGPTDIPHLSFTHHRVGIHAGKAGDRIDESDRLVPVGDVAHLPEHERLRLLGLASEVFGGKLAGGLTDETRYDPVYQALGRVFHDRARLLLEEVRSRGPYDPEVEAYFSRLYWRREPDRCIEHAEVALRSPQISQGIRQSTLYHLASSHFDLGRYDEAFPYLEELVRIERSEITMMLLAICYQKRGNLPEAVRLTNEAILAAPDRADLHTHLASLYRKMGKAKEAERHEQRAALLERKVPQFGKPRR
jgi:hypothetical protein